MRDLKTVSLIILFSVFLSGQTCNAWSLAPATTERATGSSGTYDYFLFIQQNDNDGGVFACTLVLAEVTPSGFKLQDVFTTKGEKLKLINRWSNMRLLCVTRGKLYAIDSHDLISIDLDTGKRQKIASAINRPMDYYDDGRLYTFSKSGIICVYDFRIGAFRTIVTLHTGQNQTFSIQVSPHHKKLAYFEHVGKDEKYNTYDLNVVNLETGKLDQPFPPIQYVELPPSSWAGEPIDGIPLIWLDEQTILFVHSNIPEYNRPKERFPWDRIVNNLATANLVTGRIRDVAKLPSARLQLLRPNGGGTVPLLFWGGGPAIGDRWQLDVKTGSLVEADTHIGAFRLRDGGFSSWLSLHYAREVFHRDKQLCKKAHSNLVLSISPDGKRIIWSRVRSSDVQYYDQQQNIRTVSNKGWREQNFLWIANGDLRPAGIPAEPLPGWTAFFNEASASTEPSAARSPR